MKIPLQFTIFPLYKSTNQYAGISYFGHFVNYWYQVETLFIKILDQFLFLAIDFKLCGKAKFHWTEEKTETDSEGKTHRVTLSHCGKENYINVKITLVGGKGQSFVKH